MGWTLGLAPLALSSPYATLISADAQCRQANVLAEPPFRSAYLQRRVALWRSWRRRGRRNRALVCGPLAKLGLRYPRLSE